MNHIAQRSFLVLCCLVHFLCSAADPLSQAKAKLATEAHQVLINYCGKCHGKGGSYSDEMLLDHKLLLKEEFVLAGKADKSDLYTKIAEGDMPPKKQKPVPADKLAVIKRWIDGGAPDWNLAPQEKREFISMSWVIDSIVRDLEKRPKLDRQFVRYYTLTHLYNAGESNDALGNYRIALSKLVNSLSWETEITNPVAIDSQKTILRLDLRDYGWTKEIWRKITDSYPYAVNYPTKNYESLRNLTTADVPFLRTDWFISTAGLPPLYHDILELPNTDKELEDKLNVNVRQNLRDSPGRRVWRSGFLESGPAQFNRIVERHTSPYGAYWKSYDFDSNNGLKNIFQNPIGFKHAGGEIIFNLPNGLQAYLLADSAGRRINEAPVNIVFTDQGTDPIIRNGLTCMSCHTAGMKEFKDRAGELHLAIQATPFDVPDEKEYALALYPDAATINKLVGRDKQKFEEAVSKLGGVAGGKEPIALLTERYEEPLGAKLTAAELGIAEAEFISKLKGHELLKSTGLNTLAAGGTIARETWEELFPMVVTSLGTGDPRFNNDQFRKFNKTLSAVERRKWIEETLKGGDRQGGAARITIPMEEYLKLQKQLKDALKEQAAILKQITALQTQFTEATDKAERERISRELAEVEKRTVAVGEAVPSFIVGFGQGKVILVDKELGFIVANFANSQLPPAKQTYYAYRGNQQVGEVTTTGQTDETYLVADINKGDIRVGDLIRLKQVGPTSLSRTGHQSPTAADRQGNLLSRARVSAALVRNSGQRPVPAGVTQNGQGTRLSWLSRSGARYQVQSSNDRANWKNVGTSRSGRLGSDSMAIQSGGPMYYRVVRQN